MPIYEYFCAACGEEFSRLQKIGGEKDTVCPKCGSGDVARKISACTIGGGAPGGSVVGGG